MRPTRRTGLTAWLVALLLAVFSLPSLAAEVGDTEGDIDDPTLDIVSWEAGVLPPDSDLIEDPGEGNTYVWVRLQTAGGFFPSDDLFSWFAAFSMFFPDPDNPGQTIHLSMATQRHAGEPATFPECAPDSSSCPPEPFEVFTRVLDDGSLLMVACIPYSPEELRVRVRTGMLPTEDGTFSDDWGPDDMEPQPVDLTPRDPRAPEPTTTTTEPTTTQAPPPTAAPTTQAPVGANDGGGLGVWLLVILAVLALGGLGWWLLAARRDPCKDMLEALEKARKDCEELRERARAVERDRQKAAEQVSETTGELEELCREWPPACADPETFVELPDQPGSRIDQRELRLREMYAGDAWSEYMASPGPETARAAEEAWERASEGEVGEDILRRDAEAAARKTELESRLDEAKAESERLGREVGEAEAKAEQACRRAAELEEAYEKRCGEQVEEGQPGQGVVDERGPEPVEPVSPDAPGPEEPLPPEGDEPAGGGTTLPPPPPRPGCEEGATRWETFDGPHPFRVIADEERVEVVVMAIVGDGNLTVAIPGVGPDGTHSQEDFLAITPGDCDTVADSVSDKFEQTMGGRRQQLFIGVGFEGQTVSVTCERELRCVDGEWVDTGRRRCRHADPVAEPRPVAPLSVMANVGGTVMEAEEVRRLVRSRIAAAQASVRRRREAADQMEELCRKCAAGERG